MLCFKTSRYSGKHFALRALTGMQDGYATASPSSLAVTKAGTASSASAEKGSIVSKAARMGLTIVLTSVGKVRSQ